MTYQTHTRKILAIDGNRLTLGPSELVKVAPDDASGFTVGPTIIPRRDGGAWVKPNG